MDLSFSKGEKFLRVGFSEIPAIEFMGLFFLRLYKEIPGLIDNHRYVNSIEITTKFYEKKGEDAIVISLVPNNTMSKIVYFKKLDLGVQRAIIAYCEEVRLLDEKIIEDLKILSQPTLAESEGKTPPAGIEPIITNSPTLTDQSMKSILKLNFKRIPGFFRRIIKAGTEDLNPIQEKKVLIVNTLCLVTAVAAFTIGPFFYIKTGYKEIFYPALLEGLAFTVVILFNKLKKYQLASLSMMVIHCAFALYFGMLLGQLINITLIVVFLVAATFLIYSKMLDRVLSVVSTAVTLFILESNFYLNFFSPLQMSRGDQFLLRWVALPVFLLFVCLVLFYYIQEVAQLYRRIKMWVYRVAHEIRINLNTVEIALKMLQGSVSENKHQSDLVDLVMAAHVNMKNIAGDVLQFAEIESGTAEKVIIDNIEIRSFIKSIVHLNEFRAKSRKKILHFSIREDVPVSFKCDSLKLNMILTNLLSNAIKYADPSTVIRMIIFQDGNNLCISIENECPNIPPKKLKNLFESFITLPMNQTGEGTGLGLYIVKNLVNLLTGTITVQSQNNRTVFSVILPLSPRISVQKQPSIMELVN